MHLQGFNLGHDLTSTRFHTKHSLLTGLPVVQSFEASYHFALGPLATGAVLGPHCEPVLGPQCQPVLGYPRLATPLVQRIAAFLDLLPWSVPSACLGRR